MVYKMKDWFIYEPGDTIRSLESGRKGLVVALKGLDVTAKTQLVDIVFKNEIIENVSTGSIELVRRVADSVFPKGKTI